jgi:hypothetical protein
MVHRLATPEGRRTYGLRKHTPEPVFGIIKSVMGFRKFHPGRYGLVQLSLVGVHHRQAALWPASGR